jgi:dinuclear metal center YbgI/SA1388 family protein
VSPAARLTVGGFLAALEERAPAGTAEDWDNVGLLAGDPAWPAHRAVISIDLTEEAIAEARRRGARLIVNHHPCIFPRARGLARVTPPSLVFEALRHGIAVVAAHTNFDRCALEVVRSVSHGLRVRPMGRLVEEARGQLAKLTVFVPEAHAEAVRAAVTGAGAGHVGHYDSCAFLGHGTGTFRGGEGTRPFLGSAGSLEKAREMRLETVFPRGMERPIIDAMLKAHPYEEVAYDIHPLEQAVTGRGLARGLGYGFWGELERPVPFARLSRSIQKLFKASGFLLSEPAPKAVRRLGFVAGKGAAFVAAAAGHDCDLFITGEVGYHQSFGGSRRGMAVMEVGHRESERFFLTTMEGWLTDFGCRPRDLRVLNDPRQRFRGSHS